MRLAECDACEFADNVAVIEELEDKIKELEEEIKDLKAEIKDFKALKYLNPCPECGGRDLRVPTPDDYYTWCLNPNCKIYDVEYSGMEWNTLNRLK